LTSSSAASKFDAALSAARAELARRKDSKTAHFRKWANDPLGFVDMELLGFMWSKQKEICESVRDSRFTAVQSCHDTGKTRAGAIIGCWWLSVHPPGEAFFVSTAPTGDQVKGLLWREINQIHAAGRLPGRTNLTEWFIDNQLVGWGRSVREAEPTAFQGIHARRVLVLLDESCGVPKAIWDAAETLVANEDSRFVAMGNPDDPNTEFGRSCKPGSGYNVIKISAFDSPNFTSEKVPDWLRPLLVSKTWVDERRRKWGEDSPLWKSKVLGEFPDQTADGLVPIGALRAATEREGEPGTPVELGVDVARFGTASTTIYSRRGAVARREAKLHGHDTMKVTGEVVKIAKVLKAQSIKVDDVGVGGGVTDRLRELKSEGKIKAEIVGVNVGESPASDGAEERFSNLRAELNWGMRERFIDGRVSLLPPADGEPSGLDDLLAQAAAIKYRQTSSGLVRVETKEEMQKRGLESPDDWDGLVLAFAPGEIGGTSVYSASEDEFVVSVRKIGSHWPRACALEIYQDRVAVLWGAWDRAAERLYFYEEHKTRRTELAVLAQAIKKRGAWVPVMFNPTAADRPKAEGDKLVERLSEELGLTLYTIESDLESGVSEVADRLAGGRLKVFDTLTDFVTEYRGFRRSQEGEIVRDGFPLMEAAAALALYASDVAMTEHAAAMEPEDDDGGGARDGASKDTGY